MVVFTCNFCGETIHKPKVEKHYQFICRAGKSLTCVDCLKDFKEDYVGHTKCLTEDERYSAKGTYQNGNVKKGEAKQESWVEMIGNIINQDNSLTANQKNIFSTLSEYSNVPRKKQKFINFMLSSSGRRISQKDIEDVWNIIEKYKSLNNPPKNSAVQKNGNEPKPVSPPENGVKQKEKNKPEKRPIENENIESPLLKKVKKSDFEDSAVETNGNNDNETSDKFSIKAVILEILSKKHTISLKKLIKKVKKAYLGANHEIEDEEKFSKKLNKKLKKISNVTINDEIVTLVQN